MKHLAFILVAVLVVGGIGFSVYAHAQTDVVTIVVDHKERGSGSGENKTATLVFTDEGTYQVADSLLDGSFSSSDTYGRLKIGHEYECKTRGMRIPYFSMWPNLVKCEEV